MIDLLKEYNAFQQSIIYFQNYIKSLSSYVEILKELNIENIYIFLKNLVVVSSNKIGDKFTKGFFKHYFLNYNNFNSSEIQLRILQTIFENIENDTSMLFEIASLKIEKIKNGFDKDINRLNKDFSSIKDDINEKNNSWLKKKMRIMELKGNIMNILQNYYDSYNNLSSKKVLERKFINEIIYLLFKYNYNRFQRIKEDDYIINSIQKELQNIIRFLGNSNNNTKIKLIEKIKNEIQYLERKKELNNKKNYFSKNVPKPKKGDKYNVYSKGKVSLTIEEKALLNEYLSSSTEDSYTSIYASKFNNTDGINYAKIQVIIEFLFFIRDKTISTIHLLSESSSFFFEFLNKFTSNKDNNIPDKNEILELNNKENEIHDLICDDDNTIEELKNNYMYNYSEEHKVKNEEIFSKLTVKSSDTINYISALNYIFRNKHKNDNINEIKYLYENISLPENTINNILKENGKVTNINYYLEYQNKIEKIYNQLNDKFKHDPLYQNIINYFEESAKEIKKNNFVSIPQILIYYENYIDNFCDFKDVYIMRKQVKEYIELIDSENKILEKMELIKEKYKYIQKELQKYLNPNQKNYENYYNEWKSKNPIYVVENYELRDIEDDLMRLIPKNETIKIIGKDKRNFSLILYLFQNDYFLEDYI